MGILSGQIDPSEDFDWESVEEKEQPAVEVELRRQCALTLARFVKTLLEAGGFNRKKFYQAAHCLAFASHLHPNQAASGEEIAKRIGMNKPAFFRSVNKDRNLLQLAPIGGSWSEDSKKHIQQTTKKNHERRKQNSHGGTDPCIVGRFVSAGQGT